MRILAISFLSLLLTLLCVSQVNADILNVPEDNETIQGAINAANDGDTVLVQPGRYRENLDFSGRDITVASLSLTTGDRAYIDSTIIDGNGNGSCVVFGAEESDDALLHGFTLTNGSGYTGGDNTFGGGIICFRNSSPNLEHLLITGNEATFGAGIYCERSSGHRISNVTVCNNNATYGGGIRCYETDVTIENVCIHHNEGANSGGGLHLVRNANPTFVNITCCDNSSENGGGIWIGYGSHPEMVNSIVYNNTDNVYFYSEDEGSSIEIYYCDIEGGEDGIDDNNNADIEWGDGNIDEDPRFVNSDEGDYHLTVQSPCVNTGDPESPHDPDGTRADMGAFYFPSSFGTLAGTILDAENGNPVGGAQVAFIGIVIEVNENGEFFYEETPAEIPFDLLVSSPGYNDSTLIDLMVAEDETLEVEVSLLHPEFDLSIYEISDRIAIGDIEQHDFTLNNNGNGSLEWQLELRLAGGADAEPWQHRESYMAGENLDDDRINGVVYVEDLLYIAGSNDDEPNLIYVVNREGELVDTFQQAGGSTYGMYDMTWDGELLWGSGERLVFGFTTDGELQHSFIGGYSPNKAITWDNEHGFFWMSSTTSDIMSMDREGEQISELDHKGLRIYGLTYYADDPDDYNLYILHEIDSEAYVTKMNIDNGDTLFVAKLEHDNPGRPSGCFMTGAYDMYSRVMLTCSGLSSNDGGDRIDVWQVCSNTSWMQIAPTDGIIQAGDSRDIAFVVDASDLNPGVYESIIEFTHNALEGAAEIIVSIEVYDPAFADNPETEPPAEFYLAEAYPNPFNALTRIEFGLPEASSVRLGVYDLTGRLIEMLQDGYMTAGRYRTVWDAYNQPAGVFFIRLETTGYTSVKKVTLLK